MVDNLYDMKEEYNYETTAEVIDLTFIKKQKENLDMIVGSKDGSMMIVSIEEETDKVVRYSLGIDKTDSLVSFSIDYSPLSEVRFHIYE